jgi:hypothetical protein
MNKFFSFNPTRGNLQLKVVRETLNPVPKDSSELIKETIIEKLEEQDEKQLEKDGELFDMKWEALKIIAATSVSVGQPGGTSIPVDLGKLYLTYKATQYAYNYFMSNKDSSNE